MGGGLVAARGVRLWVEVEGAGPPVVLLHGFTGSTETWHAVVDALSVRFRTIAIDLVGHGRSDAPADLASYSMAACVAQVESVLDALQIERAHFVGYSMGGRVALAFALAHPERMASTVLVGASAGVRDSEARAARVRSDEKLAREIERHGVEKFVDRWMSNPLFESQRRMGAEYLAWARRLRLGQRATGLANSLRGMGTGAQLPLVDRVAEIRSPVRFLVGDQDAKFRAIARDLAQRMRCARVEQIADSGHAPQVENRADFISSVEGFILKNCETTTGGAMMSQQSVDWKVAKNYEDIRYEKSSDGMAKITINRPEVRNAFRPKTLFELIEAFADAREDPRVGVVLFTGEGPDAFCSGGDQRVRGEAGYVGEDGVPRLNALDLQRVIRSLPKPVIALVAGYAIGGGHVLHLLCDLTIAAENARFGQTGPRVGSFDAGFGSAYLARVVGQKKAREIWFLCRQYDAQKALDMGLVNTVVPLAELEATGVEWAREILQHSPIAIRCLKAAMNADCDGQAGIQELAGNATMLFYMSEEGQEGRDAYLEKRPPDFERFPWRP